ncbi:MAG: hypothetical protein M3R00_02150 [Pseudomonadota bacterium]|nr:hypothetical protein [Pseudomonadota bacterium]
MTQRNKSRLNLLHYVTRRSALRENVVYDISDNESYRNAIKRRLYLIQQFHKDNPKVVLVGNKQDLVNHRQVEYGDAKQFAASYDLAFFETSAKEGENVTNVFRRLVNDMISQQQPVALPPILENPAVPTASGFTCALM